MDGIDSTEAFHAAAAAWLRSAGPMPEQPFGTGPDWSLEFPGALAGGLIGHLRFYVSESIPNDEKRRLLLNALYVLAWTELSLLFPKRDRWTWRPGPPPVNEHQILDELDRALELAEQSRSPELARWSAAVRSVLRYRKNPRFGFWCGWGWSWQWPLTGLFLP